MGATLQSSPCGLGCAADSCSGHGGATRSSQPGAFRGTNGEQPAAGSSTCSSNLGEPATGEPPWPGGPLGYGGQTPTSGSAPLPHPAGPSSSPYHLACGSAANASAAAPPPGVACPSPYPSPLASPRSRGVVLPCPDLGQPVAARPRCLWLGGNISPANGPRFPAHAGGLPRWGWAAV
jgi:hypothetical protein